MQQSSFKLSLQIGASIAQSFTTALKGSEAQLGHLGACIDKLKRQQGTVNKVSLSEVNVIKARIAYEAASKELVRLRRAMQSTTAPSKALQQQYAQAKQKLERLSAALEVQRNQLQRHRSALQQEGLASTQTANAQAKLGASLTLLTDKYQRLSKAMRAQQALKSRRSELRGQLFDAVALGTTIVAPIKIAVDFEQSIAKLGAITRASNNELQALQQTARQLGESTQFTASQAAAAMTFLGMAGFTTNQILAATPGVLELAQAASSDLAETADIASNILSGFALQASSMGRVGDTLAATFTTSNTTLQMLGDTLKYAAPVASSVGVQLETVAAMAGLLGNVGIQGSMAGTVLRAVLLRLSAPSQAASHAFAELGVEVTDFAGNVRPLPELLNDIADATKDLGNSERASWVKQIFGEEAAAGATELLKQAGSGQLQRYIATLQQAQGTTRKMAATMSKTTYGAFKRLSSALESVAISLGSVLLPTLAAGAEWFAKFGSSVARMASKYPRLTRLIVGVTTGLIAFKVVAIASAYAYTFLKGAVLSLVVAYRAFVAGLALARVGMVGMNGLALISAARLRLVTLAQTALNLAMRANHLGLIVLGLTACAGAAYALIRHWRPLHDFFHGLWTDIQAVTRVSVDWMMAKVKSLMQPLQALGRVWNKLSGWVHRENLPVSSSLGQTIAAPSGKQTSVQITQLLPLREAANTPASNNHTMHLNAPITIYAQAGMNEKTIAAEVQKALQQHTRQLQSQQRAALYDKVG